jgi:ribosome-binding factor A
LLSRRTERLAALIRQIVAEEIQNLNDPRVSPMTSITRVAVSEDLSTASVHVSVMGTDAQGRLTVQALQHAAGRFQQNLGRELSTRLCPRLNFQLDESLKRGFEVVQIIEQEMQRLEPSRDTHGDATPERAADEEAT